MSKNIKEILETNKVKDYLLKRSLLTQYINKKKNILNKVFSWNYLKLREPKKDEVWYFKINK